VQHGLRLADADAVPDQPAASRAPGSRAGQATVRRRHRQLAFIESKSREQIRWRVSLMTKTPARFIDLAYAPDAQTAEKQVAEAHGISDTLPDRLVEIREDF